MSTAALKELLATNGARSIAGAPNAAKDSPATGEFVNGKYSETLNATKSDQPQAAARQALIHQPDYSDTDYAPSDHEDEEEKASTPPSQSTNNVGPPYSPFAADKSASFDGKLNNHGQPTVSRSSSSPSPKATLMTGHIPPLLNVPRIISGGHNLERKRASFALSSSPSSSSSENQLQH
ncbi:hypothetical protein PPTG_06134 [Phytophthora nicotianae INRA-310]|uniref:Uncharacterized protein n=1 Tax=Phytophthora nicotianae (strain INRA-310) TaxID=761204 RepID=W2QRP1_PHYN3|nr:hypothetical protein PPTG_06134 [Phytophthora nicotianae INRA-310]ETN15857.1 hypothetical protein PPTG_06134 [Phytophthora nicotianae INRA-310]